jgi:formate dehydrogenase maturation protein FdhE
MGDRYIDNCPYCNTELFFANWGNYTDRCLGCGRYFKISLVATEISEKEYTEIKKCEDTDKFPEVIMEMKK